MRLNQSLQPTLTFVRTRAIKRAATRLLSMRPRCSCSTLSTLSTTSSHSIPPSFNKSSTPFKEIAAITVQATVLSQRSTNYAPNQRSFSTSPSSPNQSQSSTNPTRDAQARFAKAQSEAYKNKNRSLFMYTAAVFIAGLGVTYAAVPLYRAFCSATGFSGTPIVGETGIGRFAPSRLQATNSISSPSTNGNTTNRRIRVTFNSDSSGELPWKFKPSQKEVYVLPGETALAFFEAENYGDRDVTGIATYNVAPDRVAPYFAKVECFCFESQRLLAKEQVDLPVFFFIDSDILDDPACKDVQDVVLSYTFFAARRNEKSGQLEPDTDLSKYQVGMDLPGVK